MVTSELTSIPALFASTKKRRGNHAQLQRHDSTYLLRRSFWGNRFREGFRTGGPGQFPGPSLELASEQLAWAIGRSSVAGR